MSTRYKNTPRLINSSVYYEPLREPRDVKKIVQYATPRLLNPTQRQRSQLQATQHVWAYGDRLYNLANQFYGDPTYWWAIAWYNGYPTEAHIWTGAIIYIPLDLEKLLGVLNT